MRATSSIPDCSRPGEIEIPQASLPDSADLAQIISTMDGLCAAAGNAGFSRCPYTFYFKITGPADTCHRAVIVTMDPSIHAALMRDLKVVEKREGGLPRMRLLKLSAGPKTTFRTIFQQMSDVPISAFSVTCPNPQSGEFLFAQFFLRTQFTVSELKKEMSWAKFVELSPDPPRHPCAN